MLSSSIIALSPDLAPLLALFMSICIVLARPPATIMDFNFSGRYFALPRAERALAFFSMPINSRADARAYLMSIRACPIGVRQTIFYFFITQSSLFVCMDCENRWVFQKSHQSSLPWAWLSKNMHICECQCLLTSPGQGAVTSRIQVRPSLLSRMDIHCQCVQFNWRWFSGAQARGGEQAFGCRGWRRVWCCTMGDRCSAPAAWYPWHIPFICCKQKVGIGISLN